MSGRYAPVGGDRSWWKIPSPLQAWSPWKPLLSIVKTVPAAPGLYRLRRVGEEYPDYVGDTGSSKAGLRKRFDILRHVHDAEMPYRWPYAAMPALWALRDMSGMDLEASFVAVEATGPLLAALKATAIAIQRQDTGESPIANFGRMPPGYVSSSSYSCELIHSGGLSRGGRARTKTRDTQSSFPPAGPLDPNPSAPNWCGLRWHDHQLPSDRGIVVLGIDDPNAVVLLLAGPSIAGLRAARRTRPDRLHWTELASIDPAPTADLLSDLEAAAVVAGLHALHRPVSLPPR
jgi:hypothetical protein